MKLLRLGKWQTILFTILIFLVQTEAVQANSAKRPPKINIGYMAVSNPLTVAKELGWIEKALGLPVQWVEYESGRHVLKAISASEVDLMHLGSTPCASGIAIGLPIEVVWVSAVIADGEALVVRQKAGIESLSDLAGKKVATPFESTSHYALKIAMKLDHVEENLVEIINLDPEQLRIAWDAGEIQAGYVWDPVLSQLVDSGGKILLSSKELALRGFPTADLFAARKSFSQKYPEVALKVIRELNRAAELCRVDPAKASLAVSAGIGISPEQARKQMEGMIFLTAAEQKVGRYIGQLQWEFGLYTLLKDAADFLEQQGTIENSPPWPAFRRSINPRFIDEIYKQLKRPKY